MTKRKRVLSAVLAGLLMGQSVVYAGFFDGLGNGFTSRFEQDFDPQKGFGNFTEAAGGFEEGFFSFGSGEYRFRNHFSTKPWLDFEGPRIDAGCNGLSFDLGFSNLLDFDDIGRDIGNAAGAVMYGILIALINSVPTINQIINQIKSIIQYIQNLLRNACNFSQQMATQGLNILKDKIKDKAASSNSAGMAVVNVLANSQTYLDSAASMVKEDFGTVVNKVKLGLEGKTGGNAGGTNATTQASDFVKIADPIFNEAWMPSVLRSEKEVGLEGTNRADPAIIEIKADSDFNTNFKNAKMQYLIAMAIVGDIEGMSTKTWNQLYNEGGKNGESIKAFMDLMQDGKIGNGAYSNFVQYFGSIQFKAKKEGDPGTPELDSIPVKVGGESGLTFLQDLIYAPKKILPIPTRYVVRAKVRAMDKQDYILLRSLEAPKPNDDNNVVNVPWEGLVKESAKAQYCWAKNELKQDGLASAISEANGLDNNVACQINATFGLVAPMWTDIMSTMTGLYLQSIDKKDDKFSSDRFEKGNIKSLSKVLSLMNAQAYLNWLLNSIQHTFDVTSNSPKMNKMSKSQDERLRAEITEYQNKLQKEIDGIFKTVKGVEDMLKAIDKNKNKEKESIGGGLK